MMHWKILRSLAPTLSRRRLLTATLLSGIAYQNAVLGDDTNALQWPASTQQGQVVWGPVDPPPNDAPADKPTPHTINWGNSQPIGTQLNTQPDADSLFPRLEESFVSEVNPQASQPSGGQSVIQLSTPFSTEVNSQSPDTAHSQSQTLETASSEKTPSDKSADVKSSSSSSSSSSGNGDKADAKRDGKDSGKDEDEKDKLIKDLSERLEKMEASWGDYQSELKEEAAEKKKKSWYKMSGRVHFDYWDFAHDTPGIGYFEHPDATQANYGADPEDRWAFRRLRLEIQGGVPQNMEFRLQVDFANPGRPAYKDAYIGWTNLPYNQVLLIGNQKRPMGLDHLNSSRHNVFAERPLAVEAFNEDARRLGLCMYGNNDAERLIWAYGIYSLENTSESGQLIGDSQQMGHYGRFGGTPWYDEVSGGRGYWHTAVSYCVARPDGNATSADTNSNEARFRTRPEARSSSRWLDTGRIKGARWFETVGLESMLNVGAFQLTGEYFFNMTQRDNTTVGTGPDTFFHGGYIFASYFLTGEHIPYSRTSGTIDRVKPFENFFLVDRWCRSRGRKAGWGAVCVAARYDYLDLTDQDILGGRCNSGTLGLNWYWTPYSKLQTNMIWGDIQDHKAAGPLAYTSGKYSILGMRFMIDF